MLNVVILNTNGLHDKTKWANFWCAVPKLDIVFLQETHLTQDQLYAFQLHTQRYNWTFSLGTSNSASICIGVKCNLNVKTNKVGEILGCLIALDIIDSKPWQLITIYALNESSAQADFFSRMGGFISENYACR